MLQFVKLQVRHLMELQRRCVDETHSGKAWYKFLLLYSLRCQSEVDMPSLCMSHTSLASGFLEVDSFSGLNSLAPYLRYSMVTATSHPNQPPEPSLNQCGPNQSVQAHQPVQQLSSTLSRASAAQQRGTWLRSMSQSCNRSTEHATRGTGPEPGFTGLESSSTATPSLRLPWLAEEKTGCRTPQNTYMAENAAGCRTAQL